MVLPKPMRIKGHKPFNFLQKKATRYQGSLMLLRVAKAQTNLLKTCIHKENASSSCRCAVSISCKVSKRAVIRNRIRRYLHNHLRERLEHHTEHADKWALLTLKQNSSSREISSLIKECDHLLKEAGLYP